MKLSEHFTLAECTKTQVRLPNQPPAEVIENMRAVCEHILEPVREHFGRPVVINSFFRSLGVNRAIKSKDNSQHVKGEAVDFEVPGIPNAEVAEWVRDNLTFDQCILEFYRPGEPSSGWVHVSLKMDVTACRAQCLTINEGGTFQGLHA